MTCARRMAELRACGLLLPVVRTHLLDERVGQGAGRLRR